MVSSITHLAPRRSTSNAEPAPRSSAAFGATTPSEKGPHGLWIVTTVAIGHRWCKTTCRMGVMEPFLAEQHSHRHTPKAPRKPIATLHLEVPTMSDMREHEGYTQTHRSPSARVRSANISQKKGGDLAASQHRRWHAHCRTQRETQCKTQCKKVSPLAV